MNRRAILARALAALATLPLVGKAVAAEAAPEPSPQEPGEITWSVVKREPVGWLETGRFYALVAGDEAQAACLAQGGKFGRLSETQWWCVIPDSNAWDAVRTIKRSHRDY